MSSKLQVGVCQYHQCWCHLVSAYEVKVWCNLQVKLCNPYLSPLSVSLQCGRYINLLTFTFIYLVCVCVYSRTTFFHSASVSRLHRRARPVDQYAVCRQRKATAGNRLEEGKTHARVISFLPRDAYA